MKTYSKIALIILFLIAAGRAEAQFNGFMNSISATYSYTASSKLYLQPKSADEFLRGLHTTLEKIPGFGIEYRRRITDSFLLGIGIEYLTKADDITSITVISNYAQNILVQDGFTVIPVELTGYYVFPFSLEKFKFFMGAGAGYYFGSHKRTVGDIKAVTEKRESSFGIHVLVGVDAVLLEYLSLRGTVKFRDMDFTMYNKYDKVEGMYEGVPIQILNTSFDSKAVVDGIMFNIGLSFHF